MKLLITGGCGFLGSNLAKEALNRSYDLFVFDNLYRYGSEYNLAWLQKKGNFSHIRGDIRNPNDVEKAIKAIQPDAIFHLAGQVAMSTSLADPRMDFEVNALGTLNVLEGVRRFCPDCSVLYSSTNKVYGDLEWIRYEEGATRFIAPEFPDGFSESLPLSFHSPYGCSKGSADQYILDYHRLFNVNTVVFRHSSMYGGRQFATFDQGWVGWFCKKALEQKQHLSEKCTISGNGKQVRDLLFADDMPPLYFAALEKMESVCGEVFNIGGGMINSLSLLELFSLLESELGTSISYTHLPPRESDQKIFVADISKAKNMLGWQPTVDNVTGIRNMIKWIMECEND